MSHVAVKNVPIQATRDESVYMRQSAEKLVLEGVTSFQEMLKTTFEN